MDIAGLLQSVESSSLATWLRESLYAFPLVESLHVIGLTLVFGTIAVVDLRLLGLASVGRPFATLARDTLRWTWAAFGLTALTGGLMFITNALAYSRNVQFRLKMCLLVLAGLNVLVFNMTTGRTTGQWNLDRAAPRAGRIAAALSLVLWIGVIFLGRWVGFAAREIPSPDLDLPIDLL
jgi:hypothetical protein